jgi:hypothetical protein
MTADGSGAALVKRTQFSTVFFLPQTRETPLRKQLQK